MICKFFLQNCGNGWLAFDLAYYAFMLFTMEPDKTQYQEKQKAFYQGYERILILPEKEKRSLKFLAPGLCLFYLSVQCKRFSTVYVNEAYLCQFINSRLKTWWEYHELPDCQGNEI